MAMPLSITATQTPTATAGVQGSTIYAPYTNGSMSIPQILLMCVAGFVALKLWRGR